MTSLSTISRASLLSVILAVGACSNAGGYDSGVDDSKPFDALTDSEAHTACENLAAHIQRNLPHARQLELTCTVQALGATPTPDACRAAVETCLAGSPEPFLAEVDCDMAMATPGCSSTVGDVEQCISADLSQVFDRLDRVSCDLAGDVEALQELQMAAPTSDECTSLGDACPGFADGFIN